MGFTASVMPEGKSSKKTSVNNIIPFIFQLIDVTTIDDGSPVKFSSEVLFYVDKYEIV